MTPSGLDQSWGYADPATAAKAGVLVVSQYLSLDPSKNLTAADVKAYHQHGIADLVNWESQAGAPLKGAAQGRADAAEAVRQLRALIKAVGQTPRNRLTIYFSCDRDVTAAQIRGQVAAYYRTAREVCHAAGFGMGCYGEADLVHYLAAQHITDSEWQTYAWSGGALDPAADFYQYRNGQHLAGASVDFDRVLHPAELGAWWPPGHRYDRPATAPVTPPAHPTPKPAPAPSAPPPVPVPASEEDDMKLIQPPKTAYRPGEPWPGVFLVFGSSMAHVMTWDDVKAIIKSGVAAPVVVTRATFENMLTAAK